MMRVSGIITLERRGKGEIEMRNFGLLLENGKADLVDMDTGEILAENDRYLIQMYLYGYDGECTISLI